MTIPDPAPAGAGDSYELCPNCGEPADILTSAGHFVDVRCTELAALRARAERAEAALLRAECRVVIPHGDNGGYWLCVACGASADGSPLGPQPKVNHTSACEFALIASHGAGTPGHPRIRVDHPDDPARYVCADCGAALTCNCPSVACSHHERSCVGYRALAARPEGTT